MRKVSKEESQVQAGPGTTTQTRIIFGELLPHKGDVLQ